MESINAMLFTSGGYTSSSAEEDDEEAGECEPLLSMSADPSTLVGHGSPRPGGINGDIVQFSAPMYFCEEDDTYIEVDVIRLGTLQGTCGATYSSHDGTAKSGSQFQAVSGKVIFLAGEHTKSITVKILEDGTWTPSTEFRMCLHEPDACKLGMFQHAARVKILNGDAFPTNAYMHLKTEGEAGMEKINEWDLFLAYCKFNYNTAGVKRATIVSLMFDQLSNLTLFVTLFVGVYIVDTIFARGTSASNRLLLNDRYHTAVLISFWYVVPTIALYAWDAVKVRMDIRGTSRTLLQTCLMRTYLQYTAASQSQVSPTDLHVVMAESDDVARSYVAAISAVQSMGKIAVVMVFIILFQRDTFAIFSVVFMPLLLLLFTLFRLGYCLERQKDADEKRRTLLMLAHEACMKYRLLSEYLKRSVIGNIFNRTVEEHAKSMIPVMQNELQAYYITKFLSGCFIGLYIVVKAQDVLDNKLSLGVFLATISIFGTYLSDAITEWNNQLNIIIVSLTSLQDFTLYFNLPLEMPELKKISDERRRTTTTMRALLHQRRDEVQEATDAIPVKMEHLTVTNNKGHTVLQDVNLEVQQGRMVAVTGPPSSGKKVLLELLSDLILPTSGTLFLPSHLRVLHVSREPMFLRMSLTHNLTLGLPNEHAVDLARVKEILCLLQLEELVKVIEDESRLRGVVTKDGLSDVGVAHELADSSAKVDSWLHLLCHTKCVKLHIARALIANPNVMVLQRPLHHFNEETADHVLDVLRMHVQSRGLGYPDTNVEHRRPRTLFLIPESLAQARKADTIWECDQHTRTVTEMKQDASRLGTKSSVGKRLNT